MLQKKRDPIPGSQEMPDTGIRGLPRHPRKLLPGSCAVALFSPVFAGRLSDWEVSWNPALSIPPVPGKKGEIQFL
jgi:hypothetical protein